MSITNTINERLRKVPAFLRARMKSARERRRLRDFKSQAWTRDGTFASRRYSSYEAYLAHQRSKLDSLVKSGLESKIAGPVRVEKFKLRFAAVPEFRPPLCILCLGARLGVEVEALISLGHFAIGIDLNPGNANRFVLTGDFHALQFADSSIDAIYTNSLDHALDLNKIASEVGRVLKPGGIFLIEVARGYEEDATPGDWEAMHWPTARRLAEELAKVGNLALEAERDPAPYGHPKMPQFVLRKPPVE